MFCSRWIHPLLVLRGSRNQRRRPAAQRRRPVRPVLEALEERLTPSQTAGSYNDLLGAIAFDTAPNTNYVIDITNNFTFNSGGQVSISKLGTGSTLTIEGQNGTNFTLTGNGNRLFDIALGQTVNFKDLTLTGGTVIETNAMNATPGGGAILDQGGNVTLSKTAVEGNSVSGSGFHAPGQGGGIYVSQGGNLTVQGGSTIQSNHAAGQNKNLAGEGDGGGIFVNGPSNVQIIDSTLSNNHVQGGNTSAGDIPGGRARGGGLYVAGSGWTVTLTGDTLSGNTAVGDSSSSPIGGVGPAQGGATYFEVVTPPNGNGASGTLTIRNDATHPSILINNSAHDGGAVYFSSWLGAPAVTTAVTMSNTAFYGNQGGGLWFGMGAGQTTENVNSTTTIVNCTVAKNAGTGIDIFVDPLSPSAADLPITLDNNTITQNTLANNSATTGAGVSIDYLGANSNSSLVNTTLVNNLIQGNQGASGTGAVDLSSNETLSSATNNFITSISANAVSTANNIIGTTTTQLGNVVGVDSKGNPTGGPIYYPLVSGTVSIGAGTTSDLNTIATAEGTTSANATDEIGNPRTTNGAINLGAVQSVVNASAPVISSNPTSQGVTAGANVLFTASASGNPTPTVQWQVSSDGGKTFSAISGATSTTLMVNNVTTTISGSEYEAVFTNSAGSASTSAATLTVQAAPPAPPPSSPPSSPSPPPPPPPNVPPLLAFFNSLLGGTVTVNSDGTETITDAILGFPLLVATFDSSGKLQSILFFGINVTVLFEML